MIISISVLDSGLLWSLCGATTCTTVTLVTRFLCRLQLLLLLLLLHRVFVVVVVLQTQLESTLPRHLVSRSRTARARALLETFPFSVFQSPLSVHARTKTRPDAYRVSAAPNPRFECLSCPILSRWIDPQILVWASIVDFSISLSLDSRSAPSLNPSIPFHSILFAPSSCRRWTPSTPRLVGSVPFTSSILLLLFSLLETSPLLLWMTAIPSHPDA